MIARSFGATLLGINAHIVTAEADVDDGVPQFTIVGLPDSSVKEARGRVMSALKSVGINCGNKKIVINLAPGDLRKAGPLLDLPIAVAIMRAYKKVPLQTEDYIFAGELSLDGKVNAVNGVLSIVYEARSFAGKKCVVPVDNAAEAALVAGITCFAADSLKDVAMHLTGKKQLAPADTYVDTNSVSDNAAQNGDFADVKGQELAKRAFSVAAAGRHNILVTGPPGTGKTMLARRLTTILPPLTFDESIEATKIFSVRGFTKDKGALIKERPIRITHHTISPVALVGGGTSIMPGEISLAHKGVLFLDEITEYPRNVLETLRQPLEDKEIRISRISSSTITFPCDFMLVAASNPCPCGNLGVAGKCKCTEAEVAKYMGKLSGPLLDRIDVQVELEQVEYESLNANAPSQTSAEIKERVTAAHEIQRERFKNEGISNNGQMPPALIEKYCVLDKEENAFLEHIYKKLSLSTRSYHRILRLARTIADFEGAEKIGGAHVTEAVGYRNMDRKLWEK